MLKDVEFCMRIVHGSNIVKAFLETGKYSAVMEFPCIEKSLRRCKKDSISTDPINLRLIRVELPSGLTEVLVTSLIDEVEYPSNLFADLYHQRWGIEEDYKVLKSKLNIENFSGMSVEVILQDLYAKSLTKNLAAVSVNEAKKHIATPDKTRAYNYKINFTFAVSQLKDNIIRFMMGIAEKGLSIKLIDKISKVLSSIRPNRKFARKDRRTTPNKYPMSYKRVC